MPTPAWGWWAVEFLPVWLGRLADLHVRWPGMPIVFCEMRQLAEEWTYHYLAAVHAWPLTNSPSLTESA